MKIKINKSTNKCEFYCDRCNKKISFEDKTLKKIYVQEEEKHTIKKWDLCNKCYLLFEKNIPKKNNIIKKNVSIKKINDIIKKLNEKKEEYKDDYILRYNNKDIFDFQIELLKNIIICNNKK